MRNDFRTLTFLAAFLLLVAGASTYAYFATREIAFSPNTWQTYPRQRPRMVRDLLAKRPLDGKSRTEVESLLGAPDPSSDDDRLIYWAGSDGTIDDMWLEVSLRDGKVVGIRYYPD